MKNTKTTGTRKRTRTTTRESFFLSLIKQLDSLHKGEVTFNMDEDEREGGWVDLKVKNQILSFSVNSDGDLTNIGLYREIREVVDQKKIF